MLTIHLPFDLEDPDAKEGFKKAQEEKEYQATKPATDTELVGFIQDFILDGNDRLAYNIGFLLGLYA